MNRIRKLLSAALPLGTVLLLGACSSIPDAANPAHWYRSTADYFSGDDAEAEKKKKEAARQKQQQAKTQSQASAQAAQGQQAGESEAGDATSAARRDSPPLPAGRGLRADTGGQPRYAAAIPRQSEDTGPSAARTAQAQAAASDPPPAAAPRAPVSAAPQASAPQPAQPSRAAAPAPVSAPPAPAPQPSIAPSEPPVRTASVEETYRALLARQNQLPSAAGASGDPGTLIISSEGIETPGARGPRLDTPSPAQPAARASATGAGRGALSAALRPAGTADASAARAAKIATIQFADGSASLDAEARQILGQVAKLQGETGGKLRIVGHASMRTKPMDPDRHAKVNEGVSIARANAVAGQLARLGVKREDIVVHARGDAEPLYYEVMETGEAGNRRTEIFLDF